MRSTPPSLRLPRMPALPCGRTSPVGVARRTARSIPSPLPPINGINGGQNSISRAGSGSCPKPEPRPHRPSFITDAAPGRTGAALFRVQPSDAGGLASENHPAENASPHRENANPPAQTQKPPRVSPRRRHGGKYPSHLFSLPPPGGIFHLRLTSSPATAHRFRRRAFNEECKGAPSPDSLTLRGRVLTPPLSRRDTDRGA